MSGQQGGSAQGCVSAHGGVCPGGVSAWGVYITPLWTDTYENITFPQLLLRTVKISIFFGVDLQVHNDSFDDRTQ